MPSWITAIDLPAYTNLPADADLPASGVIF